MPTCMRLSARRPAFCHSAGFRQARLARCHSEKGDKNPLEQAGDAIKETAQKFADAQKMPDLDEESERLTKDGAFYSASNTNKLEFDQEARADPVNDDDEAPDIPFGESGSKGSNEGDDSTKPEVPKNVDEVVDKNA